MTIVQELTGLRAESLAENHALSFAVLSDSAEALARGLGILRQVPDEVLAALVAHLS
jgi:peroxiredoxin